MSPEIIQFSCGACQHVLTVPAHMAGISGPCPVCGKTITSPSAPAPTANTFLAPPTFGGAAPQQPVMPRAPEYSGLGSTLLPPSAKTGGQPQAPAWQQPGLGQTIMESAASAQAPFPQSPANPAQSEGFLPPRRAEGQAPFVSPLGGPSAPPAQAAQPMWGASGFPSPQESPTLPPPRQAGAPSPGHSSLIPGAPTLPMLGGEASALGGSLMARGLPAAPPNPMAAAQPQNGVPTSGFLPPASPPGGGAPHSRPMRKPKRATNVFMIGLALLFLSGFLVAAGWLFREPILQVAQKLTGRSFGAEPVPVPEEVITQLKEPTPAPVVQPAKSPQEEPKKAQELAVSPPPVTPAPVPPIESAPMVKPPAVPAETPLPKPGQEVVEVRKPAQVLDPKTPAPSPVESVPSPLVEVPKSATPMAGESPDASGVVADSIRLDEVTEEAKPAAEALKKFLQAGSLQERLKYTLAADLMRPIMERYYGNNPDGPVLVDAMAMVRYDPKPQIGGGAHAVFGLESKTWEYPVPVMLEMSGGSFKVDWLSFVEFKDRLLEKFLQGYQDGAARFHVGMTRTHYFEDKVPNASTNKDAFRISPAPPNPFSSVVFVDRESDLGRELRDKIPWGAQVWAIVELEWAKLGTQSWVNLSAVPQLNWYSVPSAPKAQRASPVEASPIAENTQVPTETQKAVPVGR